MQEQTKSYDGLHVLNKEGISIVYFPYGSEWKVGDRNAVNLKNYVLIKINKFLKENPGYEVLNIEDVVINRGLIGNGSIKEVSVWLIKKEKLTEGMQSLLYPDADVNKEWIEKAYPLQQVRIVLQGSRNSQKKDIIDQLKSVLARLESGDDFGEDHDDDFGYHFEYLNEVNVSQFKTPFGKK